MPVEQYKVGDHVRVKDWDEMQSEFGGDEYCIETPGYLFLHAMKHLCGADFHIQKIQRGHDATVFRSEEGVELKSDGEPGRFWLITANMIAPYESDATGEPFDDLGWESVLIP